MNGQLLENDPKITKRIQLLSDFTISNLKWKNSCGIISFLKNAPQQQQLENLVSTLEITYYHNILNFLSFVKCIHYKNTKFLYPNIYIPSRRR